MGGSIDHAISLMGDPEMESGRRPRGLNHQVPQRLFTWGAHVESWIDACDLPCKVVGYEDMWAQPGGGPSSPPTRCPGSWPIMAR